MNAYSIASICTTVLTFLAFLGIVAWAYGRGSKHGFDEAANAPFALPDESDAPSERGRAAPKVPQWSAAGPPQGAHSFLLEGRRAAPRVPQ